MEEARQHSAVDSPWFAWALGVSALATLLLAPVALIGLFFANAFFYLFALFGAAAFIRLVLALTWCWHKGEIKQWGSRICSRDTSPTGYWTMMALGVVAALILLFGTYLSLAAG